jgi:hypothetical protein
VFTLPLSEASEPSNKIMLFLILEIKCLSFLTRLFTFIYSSAILPTPPLSSLFRLQSAKRGLQSNLFFKGFTLNPVVCLSQFPRRKWRRATRVKAKNCLRIVLWDITPCSPLQVNRRFRRTRRLHLQGRRLNQVRNQRESR